MISVLVEVVKNIRGVMAKAKKVFSKTPLTQARPEKEVLNDLENICQSSGYIHTIAYFCVRDNFIQISSKGMKAEDLDRMKGSERLLRTEISTLIGLMVKKEIDIAIPSQEAMEQQIADTERLLLELHHAMSAEMFKGLIKGEPPIIHDDQFNKGIVLREPIFYAAESAYSFQYRDFSILKYKKDNEWLLTNKGFSIEEAALVVSAICELQDKKLQILIEKLRKEGADKWTLLPAFEFTIDELKDNLKISIDTIKNIVSAFLLPEVPCNEKFNEIGDFNQVNATPIIDCGDSKYLQFQHYSILEALYESPFYWMYADKGYLKTATKNRGDFVEEFATSKLREVFDKENVLQNIYIVNKKGDKVGEIDTLVTYSDRAIILQAKSKRLTAEARKGNDNAIEKDFQDAIHKAYDQGYNCAEFLLDEKYSLIDSDGKEVNVRRKYKELYLFCLISDHYPSLSFQTQQFLKIEEHKIIHPPFIMDVFFLDVISELLTTPLHFLSYVQRRSEYFDKISASNELVNLGYHLRYNLWFKDEYDMIDLGDDFTKDLDIAMLVRREGFLGEATPKGILTKFLGTPFGDLIEHISNIKQDGALDLGFLLLQGSEGASRAFGDATKEITKRARQDYGHHDFTIAVADTGITFHCSSASPKDLSDKLWAHCELKKYEQKANRWFGIGKSAMAEEPFQVALALESPWERSTAMDEATRRFCVKTPFANLKEALNAKKSKLGRNDLCSCGSGKKHKKCCLNS